MSNPYILVVDDAQDTSEFLRTKILEPEGFRVDTATDAMMALELVQNTPPDLIVSDYLMPNMTGLDLLKKLRDLGHKIPFILITAEGSESLAVQAMRLGVRDYLIKPFSIDDFLDAIERTLANSHQYDPAEVMSSFEQAQDCILVIDPNYKLNYANHTAKALFQIGPDALDKPIGTHITNTDFLEILRMPPAERNTLSAMELVADDGRTFSTSISQDSDENYIVILHDITRFKELDRAKTDFVAAISHDLRSPLTTIMGYVELLERTGPLNDQQKRFTDNILFSIRSITAMLSDLLELSKIEVDINKSLEPVHMDIITRYGIENYRTSAEQKSQTLRFEIASQIDTILGNPIRLKQMAANLIQNAIKYTPEGGLIEVYLYQESDFAILQVKDTGVGIPIEEQPHIWDKFYRAKNVIHDFDGTGLGLAIVKTIVEAHNGRIWLESIPQEGTTFTVMLPIET